MTKIDLQTISSLTNEQSALNLLNANSAVIEAISDSFLSRDGTTPNQMTADLDMNSRKILNIGDPLDMNHAAIIGLDDGVLLTEPATVNQLNNAIFTGGGASATLPYITVSNTASLAQERALAVGTGVTLTDGGANSSITVGLDGDLQAVAGLSTTGLVTRTATDTMTTRSLTAPAAGITITNPAGIAGNPTLVLANDLGAVEGLSGTGIARRTATDTWSTGTTVTVAEGGTGQTSFTDHGVVIGRLTAGFDTTGAGTAGQVLKSGGSGGNGAYSNDIVGIEVVIDGAGATLTTGLKGYVEIPFGATITQATLLANQSGSVVVDIFKCTFSAFDASATHPVSGDKITASAPPTISSATKSQDSTLTGWTTSITAGDILAFNINSVTSIQRVTLSLRVNRL